MNKTNLVLICSVMLVSGCSSWSTSSVSNVRVNEQTLTKVVSADTIQITEGDITDKAYKSLGDISVTVNKTTAFHDNPTREMVNKKLKEEAAKLGADAVVLVRYGTGGVSFFSWGSLEGKGRAISFEK